MQAEIRGIPFIQYQKTHLGNKYKAFYAASYLYITMDSTCKRSHS